MLSCAESTWLKLIFQMKRGRQKFSCIEPLQTCKNRKRQCRERVKSQSLGSMPRMFQLGQAMPLPARGEHSADGELDAVQKRRVIAAPRVLAANSFGSKFLACAQQGMEVAGSRKSFMRFTENPQIQARLQAVNTGFIVPLPPPLPLEDNRNAQSGTPDVCGSFASHGNVPRGSFLHQETKRTPTSYILGL